MECSPHYVRCIKSNDNKQALTIAKNRVEHQVKYLGLSENIKVRRAGFAYRAEYARYRYQYIRLCVQVETVFSRLREPFLSVFVFFFLILIFL